MFVKNNSIGEKRIKSTQEHTDTDLEEDFIL